MLDQVEVIVLSALSLLLVLAPASAEVGVSSDATPWLLRGFSVIANVEPAATPHLRTSLEVWGMDFPSFAVESSEANADEGWERRIDVGIAPAVAWHPWREGEGFHAGVMFNAMRSTVSRSEDRGEAQFWTAEAIPRVGFRWFPFDERGLFLDPWLGLGVLAQLGAPDSVGGETYTEPLLQPLATLHIGWRPR